MMSGVEGCSSDHRPGNHCRRPVPNFPHQLTEGIVVINGSVLLLGGATIGALTCALLFFIRDGWHLNE